jgi:outer membrane protein TolC
MERYFRHALGAAVFCCMLLNAASGSAAPLIRAGEHLTLRRAIRIALKMHPRGLEARAVARAALQRVGEARSAMLSQVYGAAQYLRSTDNGIGDTSYLNPGFIPRISGVDHDALPNAGQSFSTGNNYLVGIGAYQYLLDFGRVRGFIAQRKDEAAAAHATLQLTDLNLIFEVTQRYFGLLAAHQIVNVYKRAVAQRQEQLHAAQVRAHAGLTSEIDVYTAQATLARARVHLLDAQDQVAKAKAALDNAMGLGPKAPNYRLAAVLTYRKISGSLVEDFQTALAQRPDLRMLKDEA